MTDPNRSTAAGAPPSWRESTLAPFTSRIFLWIWSASLLSNFGGLIQAVGASWLMTSLAPSADMVALVQASTTLPIMLLSLGGGAIADIWDRRLIMVIAQTLMLVVSAVLALLTYLGLVTPWLLLALTFLIGCGTALYGPAWQSSVGEQVPRSHLSAAIALNVLAFNIARTLGPALGGVIVAALGPQAAFTVNAFSYVGLIAVLAVWRRPRSAAHLPPESMGMAMRTGLRYVRLSPAVRTVLIRGFLFGFLGSAVWALMPVIARDLIRGGALTYGFLFGAFGGGAVVGGLLSVPLRQRLSGEVLVRTASVVFGAGSVVAALSHHLLLTMAFFVMAGAAWVLALSTFNLTIQTSVPRWVVGRGLASYQTVTFGGMAIGSWLWGITADRASLSFSLLAAGLAMAASALAGLGLRLPQPESVNLSPHRAWPEPKPGMELAPHSGPVVVTVEYRVAPSDQAQFVAAMQEVRRIRRRDGARRWKLLQDISEPERFVERFQSLTWLEHLRQHHRYTMADREVEHRALALHRGPEPPRMRQLLERPARYAEAARTEQVGDTAVVTDPNLPATALTVGEESGDARSG